MTPSKNSELVELQRKNMHELEARYRELFDDPPHVHNVVYLRRRIAFRIQELAEGVSLSQRAHTRLAALVTTRGRARDPRLPPDGEILRRTYAGVEHAVTVRADGFEYNGRVYRSLSRIARVITGATWNGYAFFLGAGGAA